MKTHRLIQTIGETIGLIALASTSMNCASQDAGPATCQEAKSTYGVSVDGPQILYVGGDKTMPWTAYCDGMATKKQAEYLELNTHDGSANFSEFSERTESTAFKVRTQFRKVRIDPVNLTIDSTDAKFTDKKVNDEFADKRSVDKAATSPNPSPKSAVLSKTVDFMPYAAAETCGASAKTGAQGNVDLSNSPFEVATMPCKTIGANTVTFDDSPRQMFDFVSSTGAAGSDGAPTCGRASLNCLPDPTVNGEVGGQGKIQLRYFGYGAGSQRP